MKTYLKNISRLLSIICLAMLASCKTEKVNIPPEPHKDITGTWRITTAVRNGAILFNDPITQNGSDIIKNGYDFSTFRITFKDGTYTINDTAPFLVSNNGTWTFDQPSFTQLLIFTEDGGAAAVTSDFDYPVTAGKRQIIFSFKPGCGKNSYQYTLDKINDQ